MDDSGAQTDAASPRLMIFSPYSRGHHAGYIRRLLEAWIERRLPGTLDIVVDREFVEVHPEVVALAEPYRDRVRFIALSEAEVESIRADSHCRPTWVEFLRRGLSSLPHVEREWNLLCRYAEVCRASHVFIQYMNHSIMGLAAGLPAPCPLSGIFHDLTLSIDISENDDDAPPSRKASSPELFSWKRILRHPQLHTLFVSDIFGVAALQELNGAPVVYLPAVAAPLHATGDEAAALRAELGVEPGRKIFLLFGALDSRKGIQQTLQALSVLPQELARQVALVVAGRPRKSLRAALDAALPSARQSTAAQIITVFEFLPEDLVGAYFRMSDVVMLPYQRFQGTSGVLLQAALSGKPVLACDYGWIGKATRHFGLGLTVDAGRHNEIALGMTRFLHEPVESLYDKDGMQRLARESDPESFASLIFTTIYDH